MDLGTAIIGMIFALILILGAVRRRPPPSSPTAAEVTKQGQRLLDELASFKVEVYSVVDRLRVIETENAQWRTAYVELREWLRDLQTDHNRTSIDLVRLQDRMKRIEDDIPGLPKVVGW